MHLQSDLRIDNLDLKIGYLGPKIIKIGWEMPILDMYDFISNAVLLFLLWKNSQCKTSNM